MSIVRMTWRDTLFAHWPVAPEVVERRLPPGLDVDTYDGQAWLSVVGFRMEGIRPRGVPASLGFSFGELNLRTYVTHEGTPGIYFYNLDAGDRLGVSVARRLFDLPYYAASMQIRDLPARADGGVAEQTADGELEAAKRIRFRSRRTHRDAPPLGFDAEYGPTDGDLADPDRAAFLTERYRFFTAGVDAARAVEPEADPDDIRVGVIEHDPWPLSPATLTARRNDCFDANGFETPDGDPVVHYAPVVDVRADRLRSV